MLMVPLVVQPRTLPPGLSPPSNPPFWITESRLGSAVTVKFVDDVAVPPDVVTRIGPVVAPEGTVAVIWVNELSAKPAFVPLKVTAVAPAKADPEIVTLVPGGPEVGVKLEMEGGVEPMYELTQELVALLYSVCTENVPPLLRVVLPK